MVEVNDAMGNVASGTVGVMVLDTIPPDVICRRIEIGLDAGGLAAISEDAVDDGSWDACGGLTFDTDITTFTCSELGENQVVLTVTIRGEIHPPVQQSWKSGTRSLPP
jgi:hypothetical protein